MVFQFVNMWCVKEFNLKFLAAVISPFSVSYNLQISQKSRNSIIVDITDTILGVNVLETVEQRWQVLIVTDYHVARSVSIAGLSSMDVNINIVELYYASSELCK